VQPGFGRAGIVRPREIPTARLDLIMIEGAARPTKGVLQKRGPKPQGEKSLRSLRAISLSIRIVAQLKHVRKLGRGADHGMSTRIK